MKQSILAYHDQGDNLRTIRLKLKEINFNPSLDLISYVIKHEKVNQLLVDKIKKGLASNYYIAAGIHQASGMQPDKVEKLSAMQNMISSKIAVETARLIEGQSTEIVDHRVLSLSLSEATLKVEQILREMKDKGIDLDAECVAIEDTHSDR